MPPYNPRRGRRSPRRGRINSTARWPERLEQVATLLRADGAAVVSLQDDRFRTVFACRLDSDLAWSAVLGEQLLRRALRRDDAFAVDVVTGSWSKGYALVAPITGADGDRGLLCALRRSEPFSEAEVGAASAATSLLSLAFSDARRRAVSERLPPIETIAEERTEHTEGRKVPAVFVIEDHPTMRLGVESMLRAGGFTIAGATATCTEALHHLTETSCDVVLLDLGLPDGNGVEAVQRLRAVTTAPILVFSIERSPDLIRSALRAGAVGFIGKDAPTQRVLAALYAVVAGLGVVSAEAVLHVTRPAPGDRPSAAAPETTPTPTRPSGQEAAPNESLSPRELELLRYLAEGYTNKEIARVMVLAEDTVKKGVQTLIAKLEATDRTHAVVLALRGGLIE